MPHTAVVLCFTVAPPRAISTLSLHDALPIYLDPAVLAVADVDAALLVHPQAVREMELAGLHLAGRAPRRQQAALGLEAMDAAVAVAVRDVQVARRRRHHLGRLVERPGRARRKLDVLRGAGVGGLTALAQDHQRLAVQRELQRHVVVTIGEIDDVVVDGDPVRIGDGAAAPRSQVVAVAVEHDDGRILSLERVDAVLGISGDGADRAERPPGGQRGPRLVYLVAVAAAPDGRHRLRSPLSSDPRCADRPPRSAVAASDDPTQGCPSPW